MARPNLASGSGGTATYNTLFVDTSLDTHLAIVVSDSDTVADLKKKILYEHPLCFPDTGEIKIFALKVKRKGFYYHLSDSMFVKNAFDGVGKSWFLSVDASRIEEHGLNRGSRKSGSGNLLAIMNNPSAKGVDLLIDGPPKRLSKVDDSSVPQVESNQHVKQKSIADQFGSGDSNEEALKDQEMEIDHMVDNCSKVASPKTCKRSEPELQDKSNLYGKEFEDPGAHTGCKEDNSGDGVMDVQCNISQEVAPMTQSVAKKKRKTKKKKEDAVHHHALKENDTSVCGSGKDASQAETIIRENSSGNAGRIVSYDIEIGNKSIAEEPCRSSGSDFNNRPGTGVEMTNVPYEGTDDIGKHVDHESEKSKNDVVDVQSHKTLEESSHSGPAAKRKRKAEEKDCSENSSMENRALICALSNSVTSLEESLHSGPAAKKRRKTEKKDGNEKPSKENGVLIFYSVKETSGPDITNSDYSLGEKQRSTSGTFDGLSTAPLEDNHMLGTSSMGGKRKRKNKSSGRLDQAAAAVPSSGKDVRGESPGVTVGINPEDLGREPDASLVARQSAHSALISELKEKLCDPAQEVGGLDVDLSGTDAGNVESRNDTPELAAASAVTILKDHQAIDVEGHPAIVVQEPKNLKKDVSISRHENTILDDSNKFGTDQTGSVEEKRELLKNNDLKATEVVIASNLLDANGILESKNSSKKRKKSRKTQDSVGGEPVMSSTDHVKGTVTCYSSNEPHEAVNSDHVSEKAKKEESPTEGKEASKIRTVSTSLPTTDEASKIRTVSTSLPATDKETDDVIRNVLESLQQVSENPIDAENMDEKSTKKKKKKKKQSSTEKNHPELQTNNEDISRKNLKLSTDPMREVDVSSTLTKKTESVKTRAPVSSGTDHIKVSVTDNSSSEPHEAVNFDHVSEKAEKGESIMYPTEGKESSKLKTVSTSLPATDRETDDVIQNGLESLEQVSKIPENAENVDEKSRKKKKKKRSSTEKNHPELQTNNEDTSRKNPKLSTDPIREVDVSSTLTKKTEPVKTSSMNQVNGSNLEPNDSTGVEVDPVHSQLNSRIDYSSQALAQTLEGNHEGRPLHDVNGNPRKSSRADEANDHMVNFHKFFVPSQHQHETADSGDVPVDKVTKAKEADNVLKPKKNKKKLDVHIDSPSPDLQSSVKSIENQGCWGEAQAGNSSSTQLQRSLSKDEGNNLILHEKKKLPKVSELKAPQSNKSDKFNSITEEVRRPNVVGDSRTNTHSKKNKEAATNSSLESFESITNQNRRGDERQSHLDRNNAAGQKASGNNTGKVVNSSEHKKSLLATSGTIFDDDSNGSSEDEDGTHNSDASTRTPSDDSVSSDYSDRDSNANFNSPQNGSYSSKGKKGKEGGGKNITISYSSGPKGVSLDTILRSSSRYKKAKLTASQHKDTESQPVETVPDSQPNL